MKEERSLEFQRRWGPSSSKLCTEDSRLLGVPATLRSPDGCFRLHPFSAWHFRAAQFEFEAGKDQGMRKGGLGRESQARARAGSRGSSSTSPPQDWRAPGSAQASL